jgi:hypothetical protein
MVSRRLFARKGRIMHIVNRTTGEYVLIRNIYFPHVGSTDSNDLMVAFLVHPVSVNTCTSGIMPLHGSRQYTEMWNLYELFKNLLFTSQMLSGASCNFCYQFSKRFW